VGDLVEGKDSYKLLLVNVAVYTRISDDSEGRGLGVARQEQDARTIAGLRGWNVAQVYEDNDVSAFNTKVLRHEFERMLDDLAAGVVDGCVVYDLDRFARQPTDLERAIRIFDDRPGMAFATVQGDIDLSSPDGRTMARVMVAFANKSSMDTSRRAKRKHLELAQQGALVGTGRVFGYEDDRVTLKEDEALLIRRAAADIISGVAMHAIARSWNEQGVKTPYGNIWRQAPLRQMMLSPRLAGYRVHKKAIALDADGSPVMAQRPPILDVEVWEAVCATIRDRSRPDKHAHAGGRKRLLAGIVRCGRCGTPMTSDKDRRRNVHTYVCKSATSNGGCGKVAVSGERVDELITDLVLKYLSSREIQIYNDGWLGEDELSETTSRISELMAAFASGQLSKEVVFPSVQKLEERASVLRAERSTFLRERTAEAARPTNIADVWPGLDIAHRRAVIESVLAAAVIKPAAVKGGRFSPDRVDVVWR
jgi:DNA invertase Pin-like site-specific DNA recombinase